jgi:hypothetical protein
MSASDHRVDPGIDRGPLSTVVRQFSTTPEQTGEEYGSTFAIEFGRLRTGGRWHAAAAGDPRALCIGRDSAGEIQEEL